MAEQKMRYLANRQAGDPPAEGMGGSAKKGEDEIWVKKDYVLFDLDGTLTDPKMGITKCVQYSLQSFGVDEPDLDKLEPFIGPPLKNSFMERYGFDEEKAQKAVEKYRERFNDVGIYENEIYRGVPEMLKRLKLRGIHLGVASSKPTVYVERILEYFHIREYFEVVVGSELDGTRTDKAEVVQEALRRFFPSGRMQKHKVFMVGDRSFDVVGARNAGVEGVGVSYGYGSMEELMGARADYVVRSVEELRRFLLRGHEDMEKDLTSFQKTWILISQFIIFIAVRGLVVNFCYVALASVGITERSDDLNAIILALGFLVGGAAIFKRARGCIKRTILDMHLTHLKEEPASTYVALAIFSAFFSLGFAMLLNLSGFAKGSDAFQKVAENQASASLLAALITYGLVSPLAEELLFRGIIYGYVRKFFDVRTAIIGSAILFGIYHGNMVQALNATVLGYFIAYAYEYFGNFWVPVLMHVGINVLALLVEYLGLTKTGFACWPVCAALLILGLGAMIWLIRRKKVS